MTLRFRATETLRACGYALLGVLVAVKLLARAADSATGVRR